MIVAPDWTTLRGIATGLDADAPVERQQALERIVKLISDELPDIEAVRLYDVQGEIAIVRHATDKKVMSADALSNLPLVARCIAEQRAIWLPEKNHWAQPLMATGRIIGAMELLVEDLDDEWLTWLDIIVTQIAHATAITQAEPTPTPDATQPASPLRRSNRLITASRMLLAAEEYDDIATAAMYMVGQNIAAVTITIFEQPLSTHGRGADGMANNRRFVGALATRDSVRNMEADEAVSSLPEQSFVTNLRQEIPLIIDNVQTDAGYLSGWMRETAISLGTKQVIAFGLTSDDLVIGTMELYALKPYNISQAEIDLYTALATQIGNVILGKRLLQQSQEAQRFASQLVTTNKAIAEAEDYVEMAHAVLNDMPEDIETIAIALFNRPFTLMGSPSNLRSHAIVTRRGTIDEEFVDHVSAIDDARVTYFLHEYLEGRMMQLWTITRPRTPVLAEQLVGKLQQEDVDVIMSFGLNMSNSLRGLLLLGGRQDLRDQSVRIDGLRAIADQLAAVIENRILLQRATDALDLIQAQYETSSRVFRAGNPVDILKAISDFAGGQFAQGELVTTGRDGVTRVIARMDASGGQLSDEETNLDDYPASQTLSVLEALEVRDTEEDVFLSEEER
ncbi:MAG: GAF domain-containing protein, partial [Chloroflexota bacterium]